MKIAFDARYLTGRGSGIGTYCDNLLRELLDLDDALELLLVTRKRGLAEQYDPARCTEVVFDHEPRSYRTLHLLPLKLRGRRFDAFHGPFNILPVGLRTPTVVTVHDIMQLQNPANIATSWLVQQTAGRFWRTHIASAIRRATRVLTVSHATRDAVLERFADTDEAKIAVTYNGTDPYFFERASDADIASARAAVGTDAPFVLCVGNESPHKNHHRAIRAFLAAFGPDDPERLVLVRRSVRHDRRMDALLARPEVKARVIIVEHVDKSVLRALYQSARSFFFPSWVEGFGLPILEAMASGCPVLTSDRSAPGELAADAALTASPFEVEEMAAALRRLHHDEALRAKLLANGRPHAEAFTWRRTAEGTLAAYRAVTQA